VSASGSGSSIAPKTTLNSVAESRGIKGSKSTIVERDPDFEPFTSNRHFQGGEDDDEDDEDVSSLRAASPLPTPPASFSSRPLQKRQPLADVQPGSPVEDNNGSPGRKPRICRSEVIARVDARRKGAVVAGTNPATKTSQKARKSQGMTSKAKLVGASAVAEAAKKKKRVSDASSRRRASVTEAIMV
jgi:hypothetical protein